MAHLPLSTLLLLTSHGPGRGDVPSDEGGVLVVVGIALVAVLAVALAVFLVMRRVRAQRDVERSGETVDQPLPSEQGRPWSSER